MKLPLSPHLLALCLLTSGASAALADPAQDIAATVNAIEKEVLPQCSKVEAKVNNTEEGFLLEETVYFHPNGQPARILAISYDSHGKMWREYTFNAEGTLIFVFEQSQYHPPTEDALVQVKEERAYFHEGKCIQRKTRSDSVDPNAKVDLSEIDLEDGPLDDNSHIVSYESWTGFAEETLARLKPLL